MIDIEKGISIEYTGAPEFYDFHNQKYAAWQQGQAVPAGYATVGRLLVEPALLEQAAAEISQLPNYDSFQHIDIVDEDGPLASQYLIDFVNTCYEQFNKLVMLDTKRYAQRGHDDDGEEYIYVGPYENAYYNHWHLDDPEGLTPGSVTYTVTLLGPSTLYTDDQLSVSDYDRGGFLLKPQKLNHVTASPLGVVTVHHGQMCAHSSPLETSNGQPRLFMNYLKQAAFKPNTA